MSAFLYVNYALFVDPQLDGSNYTFYLIAQSGTVRLLFSHGAIDYG
jgi:hypothetical protein